MLQMRESNRDRGEKEAVRVLIGSRPHLPTKFSSKISFSQLKFSKQYECVHIIGGCCQETGTVGHYARILYAAHAEGGALTGIRIRLYLMIL